MEIILFFVSLADYWIWQINEWQIYESGPVWNYYSDMNRQKQKTKSK